MLHVGRTTPNESRSYFYSLGNTRFILAAITLKKVYGIVVQARCSVACICFPKTTPQPRPVQPAAALQLTGCYLLHAFLAVFSVQNKRSKKHWGTLPYDPSIFKAVGCHVPHAWLFESAHNAPPYLSWRLAIVF